ncbi:TOM1 [[Candida] subhashii]|uniref:HECT-type E3 ubiquitin transferase n=1 Tax=[Candida] subhashii TaxID=561895 RepID=A0A8J5QQK5_9ASCO|nr:TOM1 [[Candida] subhashii]KAG7664643.1 TOM1 [[Candida] subhashii]
MIIEKRERMERMEMVKPLKPLIDDLTNCDINELPSKLNSNLQWVRPKGDLFDWIPVLNRIDQIFEDNIKKYGLNDECVKLQLIPKSDEDLIIACLRFTTTLLFHCSERSIYNSSERIYDLINTPSIEIRLRALEVAVLIAERFIQTSSSKYAAPKQVKQKVLELARSYPPMVPIDSALKQSHKNNAQKKDEKPSIVGDHFNFVDTLTTKKKYPSKWKSINFQYYKSALTSSSAPWEGPSTVSTSTTTSSKEDKSKPAKKKQKKNLVLQEGLETFTIPEESVRKLTLEQIYDKASNVLPKEFWFSFGIQAAVAKSFNTKSYESIKLRQKLLQIKCLAVGFICSMCSTQSTSSKLLEAEPYIFSFLVDAVSPENEDRVPREVYRTAVTALTCISLKKVWGGDIIRCMGGNVSHGVLFQCIRQIWKKVSNEDDDYDEEGYIRFFSMIGNMIKTKSLIQKLSAGGILNDLMKFLNLKSKYRWSCSAATHLISIYLSGSPDSLDDFVANDGFNSLIDTIRYEVDFALENPDYGGGAPKDAIVHYTISFRQANYIRNLMILVSDIIQSDVGDRLRNLFDSPLLASFNKILQNPSIFGPLILASTIDSVFYIIHNEPTAFSILNEAKVIDTILENYEHLFLPSSTLLVSLPEVLSAICLNNAGLRKVKEKGTISTYFKSFYNLANAKELIRSDMGTNLGCSFDELGRHYPSLKPIILEEVKKLVEEIADHVDEKLQGVQFYNSNAGLLYKDSNDESGIHEEGAKEIECWDTSEYAYIIDNVFYFLGGFLQDSGQWGADVIRKIKFESWIKCLTLKNAPYDYIVSNGISSFMGILKYFDDENREYGLPVVIQKLTDLLETKEVQNYIYYEHSDESFFSTLDHESGTRLLQLLNSITILLFTITEIYINLGLMFPERLVQIVNLFGGYGLTTATHLGALLQRSIIEETITRSNIPKEAFKLTTIIANGVPPLQAHLEEPSDTPPEPNGTSAKFKNTLQIRFFSYYIQSYASLIFASIARASIPKRLDFTQYDVRRQGVEIIVEIGKIFTDAITRTFENKYYQYSYIMGVANIALYVLSQKERNKDMVCTGLAISFVQNGFYDKLSKIIIELWNKLLEMDPESVKETLDLKYLSAHESSIVKNALSQSLMIFAKSVNSDIVPDLPNAKLYFESGYDDAVDPHLISTLLINIRGIAIDLLSTIVGSESRLRICGNGESPANIPSPLIEQIIYICKNSLSEKGELKVQSIGNYRFLPFDIRNVSPPSEQVAYLISLGLSEFQANHFFKHGLSLSEVASGARIDCSQLNIGGARWDDLAESIKEDDIDFSIDFPHYKTNSEILVERPIFKEDFEEDWLSIGKLYPKVIPVLADLFISNNPRESIQEIRRDLKLLGGSSDSEALGVDWQLLALLLQNERPVYGPNDPYEDFVTELLSTGVISNERVNEPYIQYVMAVLEQVIIFKTAPIAEETKHESIRVTSNNKYYLMKDLDMDKIFESILQLKGITDPRSANGIARVLALYAKDSKFAVEIANSNLLRELIRIPKQIIKDKAVYESLKTSLVLIVRYCFETVDILKYYMTNELTGLLTGSFRQIRDLQSCLKDNSSLILRDANVFVDVISKDVRLDGYGGGEFFANKIPVRKVSKQEQESEDVEMTDAETSTSSQPKQIESTTIVSMLLTELMNVAKTDWISDPVQEEPKKDTSKKDNQSDLFANENFAYACFLIQIITELLGSYKQAKFEFLTFSKKLHPDEPLKPRSTALNFFIHQLIPTRSFEKPSGNQFERRCAISSIAKMSLMALISTPIIDEKNEPSPKKEDADLGFIRRFLVEILMKIIKETATMKNLAQERYGKLYDLFELTGLLISTKFRDAAGPLLNKSASKFDQYYITKVYVEKQVANILTGLLAELDLNFPDVDKVIKATLKPIAFLGKSKVDYQEYFADDNQGDNEDVDVEPEDVDDREETPDLFRNSTLGMYDVEFDSEEDEDDEDMYYDGEGPLEVLLSGDEIVDSDDDSSELSAIDSDEEGDEISMEAVEDESGIDDEFFEGDEAEDSEGSLGDIEIIDELDLGSHSEGESGDEGSSASGFYDFEEDQDSSEYDEDELDGWIEELQDGEPSEDEEVDGDQEENAANRVRRERQIHFEENEESDENLSDVESTSELELNLNSPGNFVRRLIDEAGITATPELSMLFNSLFRDVGFRGTIDISQEDSRVLPYPVGRFFDTMFPIGKQQKHVDHTQEFHVKSTKERWVDAMRMFYPKDKEEFTFKVLPAIINRIEEDSIQLYKKKQAELEQAKKEKEEKLRIMKEEEEKRKAEEVRQREESAANAPPHVPIMVQIGDREVDIGGTEIDPDFFEALPDDMREEVFTQYVRERRANATNSGADVREIDPDFLEALPDTIRDEILQQEAMQRRYRILEEHREEEGAEDGDDDMIQEFDAVPNAPSRRGSTVPTIKKVSKKVFFTPLVDKPGVSALIRLLFSPVSISQREYIYHSLQYMSNNKQTRIEIMSLMIAILHDCFTYQRPIEKIYSQVCNRANGSKDQKKVYKLPIGATQISVGIQIIEAVDYLLERNSHLRYYLLTEHENPFIVKKVHKNAAKLNISSKETKFALNYLLMLLENPLVIEDQTFLDILARVLQVTTRPLQVMHKKQEKASPFVPPTVPSENYRQIIKILASNDCSNATFRRTISAMQNMSGLSNAQKIFSLELSDQASSLGHKIIIDLNSLTKELQGVNYSSDSKLFSKFSAHSSDQAKLLRILTALDYMFETKEREKKQEEDSESGGDGGDKKTKEALDEIEELTGLYRKLALGNLWDALSECLRVLEEKPQLHTVANALLPLIEALMVVCKHSKVRELPIKDCLKYEAKKIDFTKEPIESLFFSFTDEHKKILNQMVRGNPNLMSGPFGMLVRNPRVLEFDNKKNYFDRKLHEDKKENHKLTVNVRREQVFLDSYRALFFKPKDEFRNSQLDINFKGEQGIDAGGVTREWYQVLSRQMFNPDYALFTPVVSDKTTFHPNRTSYINPEHLSFFKFIGRIIGKAIFDNCYLDCHFSRAVYKRILSRPQSLKDMESLDLEYFKSLMWMLENDITDVITEDFSVESDDYGEHKIIDLIPNGRNIPVTEENKQEYVRKVVEYKLQTSVAEQMDNFLIGFHEIIPKDLIAIFDEQELELLISGLPDIDVLDWQNNTIYNNYSPSSLQIQWFWRAVKSFDNEERARLLQFATGTSKVPLNGFKELSGASGTCKFSIHRDYGSTDRLPSSHTCFNQIDLPAYDSYETLRGSLLMAITEGHEGFGLA